MKYQKWIQGFSLLLFTALVITGRVQMWMLIFFGSLVGALFLGRFYCGWLCPTKTLTEITNWLYKKKRNKRKPVPNWVKTPYIRYGLFIAFVAVMVVALRTDRELPVLPALTLLGVLLTLVYVPAFWHRYLCPYGTFLGFIGKFARKKWQVEQEKCNGYKACVRVCPAEAVKVDEKSKKAAIDPALCLSCTACSKACPSNTIYFGKGA